MALIVCPECGNAVSDKAMRCPNCGFPLREINNVSQSTNNSGASTTGKRRILILLCIVLLVALLIVLVVVINAIVASVGKANEDKGVIEKSDKVDLAKRYSDAVQLQNMGLYSEAKEKFEELKNYEDSNERHAYCMAQELCWRGKYTEAYNELNKCLELAEARKLLTQIYYETRFFEALADCRATLKNPDSLQVNSITVMYSQTGYFAYTLETPAFKTKVSGQNGFGGYNSSYAVLWQAKEDSLYRCKGTCHSLDENSYDTSNLDELLEYTTCYIINQMNSQCVVLENLIDFNRILNIISLKNYMTIKRIDALKFEDINPLLLQEKEIGL